MNNVIRKAYLEGLSWRRENPAEFDDDADNWVIADAHNEWRRHEQLYGANDDPNRRLAEAAKWGKIDREAETSFLLY